MALTPEAPGPAAARPPRFPRRMQEALQLHYQRQERRRHACQAREEEECSTRSAPTQRYSTGSGYSGSHPSLAASSCSASTARSAASEPTAARTNYGGGHYCNTYEHNHHTDRRRGRPEAPAPMDSERHVMRISKLLVTEHMTARSTHPSVVRRMVNEHLPTYEERRTFYQGLKRNVGYLPMFPEPNEHPSLAMTRYVDKMFGPVLAQEVGKGGYAGGGGGSGSAYDVSPRYPQQHYLQDRDEQRSARDYLGHSNVCGSNQSYNQNVVSSMTDQPIFGPPTFGPASTVDHRVPSPGPVPIPIQRQRPTFDDLWNSNDAPTPAGDPKPIHPNVTAPSEMIPSWAQVSTPKETEEDAASKDGEELTSPVAHVTFSPSTGLSCSSAKETGSTTEGGSSKLAEGMLMENDAVAGALAAIPREATQPAGITVTVLVLLFWEPAEDASPPNDFTPAGDAGDFPTVLLLLLRAFSLPSAERGTPVLTRAWRGFCPEWAPKALRAGGFDAAAAATPRPRLVGFGTDGAAAGAVVAAGDGQHLQICANSCTSASIVASNWENCSDALIWSSDWDRAFSAADATTGVGVCIAAGRRDVATAVALRLIWEIYEAFLAPLK